MSTPAGDGRAVAAVKHHLAGGRYRCADPKGWAKIVCEHDGVYWRLLRCRKCEGCGRWRVQQIANRLRAGAAELGGKCLFLTLTSLPGAEWPWLMRKWTAMVQWLRRKYGPLEYAVRKDKGGDTGMKHLHILTVGPQFLPYKAVMAKWESLTGARVGWIRVAGMDKGVLDEYLAKYVGKLGEGGYRIWRKEVTYSKGWPKLAGGPRTRFYELYEQDWPPPQVRIKGWGAGGLLVETPCPEGCMPDVVYKGGIPVMVLDGGAESGLA